MVTLEPFERLGDRQGSTRYGSEPTAPVSRPQSSRSGRAARRATARACGAASQLGVGVPPCVGKLGVDVLQLRASANPYIGNQARRDRLGIAHRHSLLPFVVGRFYAPPMRWRDSAGRDETPDVKRVPGRQPKRPGGRVLSPELAPYSRTGASTNTRPVPPMPLHVRAARCREYPCVSLYHERRSGTRTGHSARTPTAPRSCAIRPRGTSRRRGSRRNRLPDHLQGARLRRLGLRRVRRTRPQRRSAEGRRAPSESRSVAERELRVLWGRGVECRGVPPRTPAAIRGLPPPAPRFAVASRGVCPADTPLTPCEGSGSGSPRSSLSR